MAGDEAQGTEVRAGGRTTLQQRFEASHAGRIVISVLIVAFLFLGVVWNLPDSPIARALVPAVRPVAAPLGLDQGWGMYATPSRRTEAVEVQVKMADGQIRSWSVQPGQRGVGEWDRWIMLKRAAMTDPNVGPQLAHWVVGQITEPDEQPVAVAVVMRVQTLSEPGEESSGKDAMKVLYQEALAGER